MIRTNRILGSATMALLLALAPAFGAVAAKTGEGSAQAESTGNDSQSSSAKPVTQEQLEQFASAYGRLQTVRAEYAPKLKNAEDKAERKQLRKQGQQAMVGAIRDEGLKIAEYRRIGKRLNNDKELRSRLQSIMQDNRQDSGSDSGSS